MPSASATTCTVVTDMEEFLLVLSSISVADGEDTDVDCIVTDAGVSFVLLSVVNDGSKRNSGIRSRFSGKNSCAFEAADPFFHSCCCHICSFEETSDFIVSYSFARMMQHETFTSFVIARFQRPV